MYLLPQNEEFIPRVIRTEFWLSMPRVCREKERGILISYLLMHVINVTLYTNWWVCVEIATTHLSCFEQITLVSTSSFCIQTERDILTNNSGRLSFCRNLTRNECSARDADQPFPLTPFTPPDNMKLTPYSTQILNSYWWSYQSWLHMISQFVYSH